MQVIYQVICAYFEDNCADELTNEPVMTAILEKDTLALQPTLSRFFNRMDQDSRFISGVTASLLLRICMRSLKIRTVHMPSA